MAISADQSQRLSRVIRRRRAALCSDLGLPPDADDVTIMAKAPGTAIETPDSLVSSAIDRTIDDLDDQAQARLGRIMARAVRTIPRQERLQVFALLGLGDLD